MAQTLLVGALLAACGQAAHVIAPSGTGVPASTAGGTENAANSLPAANPTPVASSRGLTSALSAVTSGSAPASNARPGGVPSATTSGGISRIKIFLVALEDNGKSGKRVGCGDSVIGLEREIPATPMVLRAALAELLSVRQQFYGQSGLYNALYQSALTVDGAVIDQAKATVRLTGTMALGGACDSPRFEAQLRETALQFPTIEDVAIFVNGISLQQLLSGRGN